MTAVRRSYDIGEGVEISVLEKGAGTPLVLVHGSVTTSELFRDTVEHFGEQYHVVAVDLRGYGESSRPNGNYSISIFAEDLSRLFAAMELERPVLLGVSMGGFVAQEYALSHHDTLRGLVLASTSDGELAPGLFSRDPVAEIDDTGWEAVAYGMIDGAFPEGDGYEEHKQALYSRINNLGDEVLRGVCRTIVEFNIGDKVGAIKVPTLIMVGTEDHQLPVSLSKKLQDRIADSELKIFEGAGHFMMLEQPEQFMKTLEDFLRRRIS